MAVVNPLFFEKFGKINQITKQTNQGELYGSTRR
jgi:hypothetical protein